MNIETIGSNSRQRTNPQTWFNAQLSVLLDDQRGECYNDTEFSSASVITFSGVTPGAFRLELACATGQSFTDNANVRTNAMRYNQSNGVGIRQTAGYTKCITGNQTKINFIGLQIKNDAGENNSASQCISLSGSGSFDSCLIVGIAHTVVVLGGVFPVKNTIIMKTGSTGAAVSSQANNTFRHCLLLRTSNNSAASTGFSSEYSTNTLINTGIFGFTTATAGSYSGSSNNATDQSAINGSSNQLSVTYTNATPFTEASSTNTDLRAIASTALAGNGVYDGTNTPTDISGTTRANPPTIGPWEITSVVTAKSDGTWIRRFKINQSILVR